MKKKETIINVNVNRDTMSLDFAVGNIIQEPNDLLKLAPVFYNLLSTMSKDEDTKPMKQKIHLIGLLLAAITQDVAGTTEEDVLIYADILIATKAINKVANYDLEKVLTLCDEENLDRTDDEAYTQILKDSRAFDHNIIREIKKILEDEEKQWIPVSKVKS